MRNAGSRSALLLQRVIVACVAAAALAGCVSTTPSVSPTAAEGTTIIFESLEGPPRPVSERLARSLDNEATARRLVVVARGGQAVYRIRGYVAAQPEAGVVAWAFDVYDADRRRAFRLRGEERAATSWNAIDDATLQRIASASVTQLMALMASDRSGPTAAAEPPRGSLLAGVIDDFRPESAGIFQRFATAPAADTIDPIAGPIPLPPHRPAPGSPTSRPATLAYAAPGAAPGAAPSAAPSAASSAAQD